MRSTLWRPCPHLSRVKWLHSGVRFRVNSVLGQGVVGVRAGERGGSRGRQRSPGENSGVRAACRRSRPFSHNYRKALCGAAAVRAPFTARNLRGSSEPKKQQSKTFTRIVTLSRDFLIPCKLLNTNVFPCLCLQLHKVCSDA